jgi:hypothetical protein
LVTPFNAATTWVISSSTFAKSSRITVAVVGHGCVSECYASYSTAIAAPLALFIDSDRGERDPREAAI